MYKNLVEAELLGLKRVSPWRPPHHGITFNSGLLGISHQSYCLGLVRRLRQAGRAFAFIVKNDKGEVAVFASPPVE